MYIHIYICIFSGVNFLSVWGVYGHLRSSKMQDIADDAACIQTVIDSGSAVQNLTNKNKSRKSSPHSSVGFKV